MLGIDKRVMCSFLDDRGRCWEFKFIPKDLILVMGTDERNLRQLTEGVTWAVQTKPWRLEVDFWRSFVNVEEEFLEGLDRRWLD
jgi:hypothetical protein